MIMRKTIIFLSLFFVATICHPQDLQPTDFTEDLNYLKNILPQKHTNLFAKITKADFERKVDAIILSSTTLTYNSFVVRLLELLVSIGDEHTFIELDFQKTLPIQFTAFKEGVFVTAISAEKNISLPAKLLAINNHPMDTVILRFKKIVQSENPSYFQVGLLRYLNNPLILQGLAINSHIDTTIYTLETLDGKRFDITINAVPAAQQPALERAKAFNTLPANQEKGNYWFSYDEPHQLLYFNYSKCKADDNLPFNQFNDSLFTAISKYRPKKLVLDLRANGGGNSAILSPFIEKIKSSYLNKKGSFYTLIGERTFSSALMNAVELKRNTNVTLVGATTSGTINHYGEVRGFPLPKTKIVIAYSTKYWETWKGKKGPLVPDLPINYSITNFMKGKDEALTLVYGRK